MPAEASPAETSSGTSPEASADAPASAGAGGSRPAGAGPRPRADAGRVRGRIGYHIRRTVNPQRPRALAAKTTDGQEAARVRGRQGPRHVERGGAADRQAPRRRGQEPHEHAAPGDGRQDPRRDGAGDDRGQGGSGAQARARAAARRDERAPWRLPPSRRPPAAAAAAPTAAPAPAAPSGPRLAAPGAAPADRARTPPRAIARRRRWWTTSWSWRACARRWRASIPARAGATAAARTATARSPVEESKTLRATEFMTVAELANLMEVKPQEVITACMRLGLMATINKRLDTRLDPDGRRRVRLRGRVRRRVRRRGGDRGRGGRRGAPHLTRAGRHGDGARRPRQDLAARLHPQDRTSSPASRAASPSTSAPTTSSCRAARRSASSTRPATRRSPPCAPAAPRPPTWWCWSWPPTAASSRRRSRRSTTPRRANVPIVVAINKIDLPNAQPERIKSDLANHGVVIEEYGGKNVCVEISAKKGTNVDKLLEMILLVAELLDLKADSTRRARGVVLETRLERGRGVVASVPGPVGHPAAGRRVRGRTGSTARARDVRRARASREAGRPSTPVEVLGWDGTPAAGDLFQAYEDEREAREIAASARRSIASRSSAPPRRSRSTEIRSQITQRRGERAQDRPQGRRGRLGRGALRVARQDRLGTRCRCASSARRSARSPSPTCCWPRPRARSSWASTCGRTRARASWRRARRSRSASTRSSTRWWKR